MRKNLTSQQLAKGASNYRYIACMDRYCNEYGFNCHIAKLSAVKKQLEANKETMFIGYREISFMEYISIKNPFKV
jgi:hypothetical protein